MSNNLSKLLVPSSINLLVERALGGHEFLEGPVFHDVPGVQVDDVVGRLQVAEVVGEWFFPVFTRAPPVLSRPVPDVFDFESWRFLR